MNLPKLRRVFTKRLFPAFFLMFFLIISGQVVKSATELSTVNDVILLTPGDGTVEMTLGISGDISDIKAVYYTNPARLVYDLENTVLVYNNGRSRNFPVEVGDLKSVGIAQFQRNPDIVRIVLYYKGGSENELLNAVKMNKDSGKLLLTYSANGRQPNPKLDSNEGKIVRITKLLHQRVGPERDRFTFKGSDGFADPKLKIVNGGVVLSFIGVEFDVPAKTGKDYQVPVSGSFIDEIQIVNQSEGAVVFLRIKESARTFVLDTQFDRISASELKLDLIRSYAITGESSKQKPVISSEGKITGLIQVLGAEIGSGEVSYEGAGGKIVRIQYQPLSIGERFIIEVAGDFKPVFKKLKYPNRISMTASNTSVVLPRDADDRFQVKIEGALSRLMKVFLKDVEGKPESVIEFYYEIPENEDIQYNFYVTDKENIYNLEFIPVAFESSGKPKPEPATKPEPKTDIKPVIEKPVEIPKQEKEITEPVKEEPKEEKPAEKKTEKSDFIAFKIPQVEKREPTIDIPKSEPEEAGKAEAKTEEKPSEAAAEKPAQVKDVKPSEPKKTVEVPKVVEEEKAQKPVEIPVKKSPEAEVKLVKPAEIPKEKLETTKPVEPVKAKTSESPKLAPIIVGFEQVDGHDKFIITSEDPINNYSRTELNFPTRLAIEFPGRDVKYGGLKPGVNHYIKGKATESVRIIKQDYPTPRTIFFVNLNQGWDNTECSMSGSPTKIIVDVTPLETVESMMIAKAAQEGEIAPVVIEPVKVVEEKPAPPPEQSKPEEAPVQEEKVDKIDQFNFVLETPNVSGDSKELTFVVSEDKQVETEEAGEVALEPEVREEPAPVIEEKPEAVKPIEEKVEPVIEKETPEPKVEEEKADIRVVDSSQEKSEKEELIAMFHPPDALPLKKGEIIKPTNCIGSINWNPDVELGQLEISATGAYLPNPDVKWFNYPSRLSFTFEDVGMNLTDAIQPDKWEKSVAGQSVSKIQVIQESGGRVPLSATAILYLKPGYDRTTMMPKVAKLNDSSIRIDLIQTQQKTSEVKPVEPVIEKVIDISGEVKSSVEQPVEIKESSKEVPVEPSIKTEKGEETTQPVVEVEKPASAEKEQLVTVVLQNADIEDVLFLIAENANIDISMEARAIKGTISMRITRKPISEVFNLIANQGNFKWNKYKDIYIFGTEDYIWSFPGIIKPKVVHLKYAEPLKVRQLLTQMRLGTQNSVTMYQAQAISGAGGGRMNVPTAQDALILKGDDRQIQNMMDVIKQIDVPPLLIRVNMKVLEFSLTDNKNIGFSWKNAMGGGAQQKGFISFSFQEKFNADAGDFTFQGFKRQGDFNYTVIYNYLVEKGQAKILADSTLTVTNGRSGEFFVGETIPFRSTFQVSDFGRVTQRIQQENVGINMRFKAQAADDDTITLYLDPDISNVKEITDIGVRTSKKNFTTTIRIKSGQPYAIGGFINESDRITYDKIPFLGDLPLLGTFFRGKNRQLSRSEIVVIFTPEIVRDSATRIYEEEMAEIEDLGEGSSTFSLAD